MIKVQDPVRIVNLKWELATQVDGSSQGNCIVNLSRNGSSSKFPLSSELVLLDSKKSIRTGVKNSLLWYHSQNAYVRVEDDYYDDEEEEEEEEEEEVAEEDLMFPDPIPYVEKLSSSLKESRLSGGPLKLLELVQRRIHRILEDKFTLPVSSSFKICIVNTVLQDFETEDLGSIYNKLFRKEGKERIMQIIELSYYDKYPLEQLDRFYDELFGSIGVSSIHNVFALNKPSFYKFYSDIWRLDREGFKDYNYQCFAEYCEEQQQQQYDYDDENFEEEWLHELVNHGILMNIEKFYFYFHRKVEPFKESEEKLMISRSRRNSRRNSGSSGNIFAAKFAANSANMKNSIEKVLNTKMKKMKQEVVETEVDEQGTQGISKDKGVKFDEMLVILDFCPNEPSCIIKHDKQYI